MKTVAIIPARFQSTRFPGKPLAQINGYPMVWHVYQATVRADGVDEVYVATDDARIVNDCAQLNLNCLLTSAAHLTGTDRLAECMKKIDADFLVNVQGDEPMIEPDSISAVVRALQNCKLPRVVASNAFTPLEDYTDISSENVVKTVLTAQSLALSFSRHAIPFARGLRGPYRKQLGLYCFTRHGISLFSSLSPGPVELAESVEMLRFLENGHQVLMVNVNEQSVPVDTPEDLARVRQLMSVPGHGRARTISKPEIVVDARKA
jgi:3-deoxy-manno-octulosonate cytidylyltransferase (CMP-KDO synthetase)